VALKTKPKADTVYMCWESFGSTDPLGGCTRGVRLPVRTRRSAAGRSSSLRTEPATRSSTSFAPICTSTQRTPASIERTELMSTKRWGTLPPGGSSMPPSNPIKLVVKGHQYRPESGTNTTAPTVGGNMNPARGASLPAGSPRRPPVTGKGRAPRA
jgi:hypothetical protein